MSVLDNPDERLSAPFSGQLSKYTNVVKGWQFRWFVLTPTQGRLEYYEREEYSKQKPRGSLNLLGAIVAPSDEDAVTFTIHAANGEVYRLRADGSRMRQSWVSHLMYVTQLTTSRRSSVNSMTGSTGGWPDSTPRHVKMRHSRQPSKPRATSRSMSSFDDIPALTEVKEYVHEMCSLEEDLVHRVDNLPLQGSHINALDQDMLLLKACSKATLSCVQGCLCILERQHLAASQTSCKSHKQHAGRVEWVQDVRNKNNSGASGDDSKVASLLEESRKRLTAQSEIGFTQPIPVPTINHEDEESDEEMCEEKDIGPLEPHKPMILHLLSQLKLGMDLTRVVLPTFILEKRSLLEMFADCMAHPDIFLRVADMTTPELRMVHVLEWYLTSFHEGRKGTVAKKPYNPIIGETFHCSWNVSDGEGQHRLVYTAEQVSHHPPVSAFHVASTHKDIKMTGSLWTKSKFMGLAIGVNLVGNLTLSLPQYGEDYVMTLPSAYARSILTSPWVELGDKCSIICRKTGYTTSIVFHTKPFYGGTVNRVSGEMKNPDNTINTKFSGSWDGQIEFTSKAGARTIDTQALPKRRKRVRPLAGQGGHESRRLWQHVTNALKQNDIDTATEHKTLLENKQREEERHRKEKGISFPTKYFQRTGDINCWAFKADSSSRMG